MSKFNCHLFICTNGIDREGKCGHKGSEELRQKIKNEFAVESKDKKVRVNASGCLGFCEQGIAAVIYPQGEWFLELKNSDDDKNKLVQKIKEKIYQA